MRLESISLTDADAVAWAQVSFRAGYMRPQFGSFLFTLSIQSDTRDAELISGYEVAKGKVIRIHGKPAYEAIRAMVNEIMGRTWG